jgi:hypothetical protein
VRWTGLSRTDQKLCETTDRFSGRCRRSEGWELHPAGVPRSPRIHESNYVALGPPKGGCPRASRGERHKNLCATSVGDFMDESEKLLGRLHPRKQSDLPAMREPLRGSNSLGAAKLDALRFHELEQAFALSAHVAIYFGQCWEFLVCLYPPGRRAVTEWLGSGVIHNEVRQPDQCESHAMKARA